MQNKFYLILFCVILHLTALPVNAQIDSLGVYFIGNSVTENLKPEGFEGIVKSSDKKITWGWNVIYGQALSYIWEHSGEGFIEPPYNGFTNALTNYKWDALTLQPYQKKIGNSDGDLVSVNKFLNLAKENSPDIQTYIYQRWPRLPDGVAPTAQSWDSLWLRNYDPETSIRYDSKDYFERLTDSVRANQSGTKKCLMIPVGEVMHRLNHEMKNGNMPGYTNIWQVYYDDIHMKGFGSYIIAATYYATLYKSDPRGISTPGLYGWFTPEQKNLVQQTVYDVILDYTDSQGEPWSGVGEITSTLSNDQLKNQTTITQSAKSLHIKFNEPFDQSLKRIQLFSITGQLIQNQIATQECILNPQHKGIYLLRIEDLTGRTKFPVERILIK